MAYLAKSGPDILCYFRSSNQNQNSEVIDIIIKKQYQQTIGLIKRIINKTPWSYLDIEVLFEKVCLFAVHKIVWHGKQLLVKQKKGIE